MEKLTEWLKAEWGRSKFLGEALGIKPHAISQWKTVPCERMGDIERITGIPMEQLRPDIFEAAGRIPKQRSPSGASTD